MLESESFPPLILLFILKWWVMTQRCSACHGAVTWKLQSTDWRVLLNNIGTSIWFFNKMLFFPFGCIYIFYRQIHYACKNNQVWSKGAFQQFVVPPGHAVKWFMGNNCFYIFLTKSLMYFSHSLFMTTSMSTVFRHKCPCTVGTRSNALRPRYCMV